MNVVHIDIPKRAAQEGRIKGMIHVTGQIAVIAAGILGIIGQHHADGAQFGKIGSHLLDHIVMQHRNGLKNEESPLLCRLDQVFRLSQRPGKGFFQDHMLALFQRFLCVLIMYAVDQADINRIYIGLVKHLLIIGQYCGNAILFGKRVSLRLAVRTSEDCIDRNLLKRAHGKQRVFDDFSCSGNSELHSVSLPSLIALTVTSEIMFSFSCVSGAVRSISTAISSASCAVSITAL